MEGRIKRQRRGFIWPEIPIDVWQKVMEHLPFQALQRLACVSKKLKARIYASQMHRFRLMEYSTYTCVYYDWENSELLKKIFKIKTDSEALLDAFYRRNPLQITDLIWYWGANQTCILPDERFLHHLSHLRFVHDFSMRGPKRMLNFPTLVNLTSLMLGEFKGGFGLWKLPNLMHLCVENDDEWNIYFDQTPRLVHCNHNTLYFKAHFEGPFPAIMFDTSNLRPLSSHLTRIDCRGQMFQYALVPSVEHIVIDGGLHAGRELPLQDLVRLKTIHCPAFPGTVLINKEQRHLIPQLPKSCTIFIE